MFLTVEVRAGSVPWLISEAQCYSVEGIRVVGLPLVSGAMSAKVLRMCEFVVVAVVVVVVVVVDVGVVVFGVCLLCCRCW